MTTVLVTGSILKAHFGEAAKRVPSQSIPNLELRIVGMFDKTVREVVPDLGITRKMSIDKVWTVLGWQPQPPEESIVDTARSLIDKGLLKQ
ncbi:hypothetical protein [Arthrobacter sp. GMC3]|uniref:hypothetical protein n=1 Tax=Arthrobacter sp. GMC3 TaxID=2058894 RepID=UPI000CE304F1|nr:hypothetical protein [Arthrobacter sp. GMC3]